MLVIMTSASDHSTQLAVELAENTLLAMETVREIKKSKRRVSALESAAEGIDGIQMPSPLRGGDEAAWEFELLASAEALCQDFKSINRLLSACLGAGKLLLICQSELTDEAAGACKESVGIQDEGRLNQGHEHQSRPDLEIEREVAIRIQGQIIPDLRRAHAEVSAVLWNSVAFFSRALSPSPPFPPLSLDAVAAP